HAAGDVDAYTFNLDAAQAVTVRLTPNGPSVSGQIDLVGPDGSTVATATATAGNTVLLQSAAVLSAGTYTLRFTSLAGSGGYAVEVDLNAALEAETFGGPTDDTRASAQAL